MKLHIEKKILLYLLTALVFSAHCWANGSSSTLMVFDLNQRKESPLLQAVADLKEKRIILVGEYHTEKNHHLAQLKVIELLHESGVRLAIGLEMFRKDGQDSLDQWVAGHLSEKDFLKFYYDNWNYPWPFYRMIFEYARDQHIKMVGLNVPRSITRQVAKRGFSSLNDTQRGKLSNITCRVDKDYMAYIRRAFGSHAHGDLNFNYFCEAQLVWDNAMAVNALDYLEFNPQSVMVILTGTGHARKPAMPEQIKNRSEAPFAVILPEVPGHIDASTITRKEADYIILNP